MKSLNRSIDLRSTARSNMQIYAFIMPVVSLCDVNTFYNALQVSGLTCFCNPEQHVKAGQVAMIIHVILELGRYLPLHTPTHTRLQHLLDTT